MAVPLKIILCFFVLFLGLVIFQSPLFSDEVGPYATDLLFEFGIDFPPV